MERSSGRFVAVPRSAGACLNDAPELHQLALNFLATFLLVVTRLNNDRLLVATVYEVHLYGMGLLRSPF